MSGSALRDRPQRSAGDLAAMLSQHVDALAVELLPGAKREGHEWKAGSVHGEAGKSLGIVRRGHKAGRWADFATGEHGDMLDLIAATLYRGDGKAAYAWALQFLGLANDTAAPTRRAERPPADREAASLDAQRSRDKAKAMWLNASETLSGTPVLAYLAARNIDLAQLRRMPGSLRYAPELWCQEAGRKLPAMVSAIIGANGQHVATHRTYLEQAPDGRWRKATLHNSKKVLGQYRGGTIRLTRGENGRALAEMDENEEPAIGEGIETCLSVALAMPRLRVLCAIALSNFGAVMLPAQCRRVVLLVDNDTHPATRSALQHAINAHIHAGRTVRLARSPHGNDFNDAMR